MVQPEASSYRLPYRVMLMTIRTTKGRSSLTGRATKGRRVSCVEWASEQSWNGSLCGLCSTCDKLLWLPPLGLEGRLEEGEGRDLRRCRTRLERCWRSWLRWQFAKISRQNIKVKGKKGGVAIGHHETSLSVTDLHMIYI